MILILEKEYNKALEEGLHILKKGELFVFPTDTVYGIGCDATNENAMEKIYELKGRGKDKPLSVVMSGLDMIKKWCKISEEEEKILIDHLPGPYTFILKLKKEKILAGQTEKIGVRVPNNFFLCKLVRNFGKPITATSANLSGKKDATKFSEVEQTIIEKTALVIDGGETLYKQPSTIVDLSERKILRKGAIEFNFSK